MYNPELNSSLMSVSKDDHFDYKSRLTDNTALRNGCIVEAFDITDDRNVSKLSTEYSVMTIQYNNGSASSVIYKNVIALDAFGGVADFFEFKKRVPADSKKTQRSGSLKNQLGNVVLLLCLDNSSEKAVIVGSIQHPGRKTNLDKDTFAQGELNGIAYKVNEDGGFSLVFKGATTADGKPKDEKIGGSNFGIDGKGNIVLSDNAKEFLKISQENKTIDIGAEKDITVGTGANFSLTATANANLTMKDLMAKASGSATFDVTGAMNIKAGGNLIVKAKAFNFTSDGDIKVTGNNMLFSSPNITLGNGAAPAIVLSTLFFGIGNLGAPVISNAIGPFSSSVKIGL